MKLPKKEKKVFNNSFEYFHEIYVNQACYSSFLESSRDFHGKESGRKKFKK